MRKVLQNKLFTKLLLADLISNFGDVVYYLALMNYVAILPEKKIAVSMIAIAENLPWVFSFLTGHIADRAGNKIRNILITLYFRAGLYILLALVMGFSPALWIALLACVVNFASDLAGSYENGMFASISKKVIPDEDREGFIAFKQSLSQSLGIVFNAAGGLLIIFMTYQMLAFLNAVTFLVGAYIIVSIKSEIRKLVDKESDNTDDCKPSVAQKEKFNIKKLYAEQKENFKYLFFTPDIKTCVVVWPFANAFFAIIMSLTVLLLDEGNFMVFSSRPITLATIEIAFALGSLVGAYFTMNYFKDFKITTFVKVDTIGFFILFLAMYYRMIYVLLISYFIIGISNVTSNAKVSSMIMNNYDEEKLGSIFGAIASFFTFGSIISSLIFSVMVLVLSVDAILMIVLTICIALIIYAFVVAN